MCPLYPRGPEPPFCVELAGVPIELRRIFKLLFCSVKWRTGHRAPHFWNMQLTAGEGKSVQGAKCLSTGSWPGGVKSPQRSHSVQREAQKWHPLGPRGQGPVFSVGFLSPGRVHSDLVFLAPSSDRTLSPPGCLPSSRPRLPQLWCPHSQWPGSSHCQVVDLLHPSPPGAFAPGTVTSARWGWARQSFQVARLRRRGWALWPGARAAHRGLDHARPCTGVLSLVTSPAELTERPCPRVWVLALPALRNESQLWPWHQDVKALLPGYSARAKLEPTAAA